MYNIKKNSILLSIIIIALFIGCYTFIRLSASPKKDHRLLTNEDVKVEDIDMYNLARENKKIFDAPDANDTIAYFDNEPITKSQFEALKQSYKSAGIEMSDEDIINKIISDKILMKLAEEKGLVISDQQALEYYDAYIADLEQQANSGDEIYKKALEQIKDMAKGYEASWDEFKIEQAKSIRQMSAIGKLQDEFTKTLPEQEQKDVVISEKKWLSYVDSLVEESKDKFVKLK